MIEAYVLIGWLTIYFALVSRWHGGGFFKAPRAIKNFAWGAPMGIITYWAWSLNRYPAVNWTWSLKERFEFIDQMPFETVVIAICIVVASFAMTACTAAKATGHGGGMDLAHSQKHPGTRPNPEKLEYLILWLYGRIPEYWYDYLMLAVIGLFSTLGAAIALGVVCWPAGLIVAIGGALKAQGYAIGWRAYEGDGATELGEILSGLFVGVSLGIACVMIKLWVLAA